MHLDAQIRYPAKIQEDKRFKKPKYKENNNDLFERQFLVN